MLSSIVSRIIAGAALGGLVFTGPVLAAAGQERDVDEALPPEPASGEWLEDTLADDSLWFASSENLAFEAIARELTDYTQGRRWVRVVDGKPAWVMYYVPGEILGFEIDTHHFGAAGTGFRFAAGPRWATLQPVEVSYEEIVAFDAKWLRLYRSADDLPPGTRFLMITFPADAEIDAARLTEVWLRCRFESAHESQPPPAQPDALLAAGESVNAAAPIPATGPFASETRIEPFVVTTFIYEPAPAAPPEFAPVDAKAAPLPVLLELPPELNAFDLIGELAVLLQPPSPEAGTAEAEKPKPLFSRIVDFVRERVLR